MTKVIVTTTINPPTEALRKFAALPDWQLVVIGDKKTPADFHIDGAIYVDPDEQEKYDPGLSDALGWNCVERRNYGFLWARDMDAQVVAVVDETVVGYAYAGPQRTRAAYRWNVEVSVYVAHAFHRRGLGSALYRWLFDLLRRQGYCNAYAGIALPNHASVELHESLGFRPVGVYERVGYKAGAWHDVGWWGLRLREPEGDPGPIRPVRDL